MSELSLAQLVANNNIGLAEEAAKIEADRGIISKARDFALRMHGDQKYGSRPYGVHLKAVATKLESWGCTHHLIAAGWLHDVIEDTMDPLPLNAKRAALRHEFGGTIEEIVWACTGEGTTRGEEFRSQMRKLKGFRMGCLVKAADRISNMQAVGDDLEFEAVANTNRIMRLSRTASNYKTEFQPFMEVVGEMINPTAHNQLIEAHAWCSFQLDEAVKRYND